MQQMQQQINMFRILFYMCLGLCIAFLILSVIFFFKFNIRNIFNVITGRSVRKTVQSMEEKNAHIGSLKRTGTLGGAGKIRKNGSLSLGKELKNVCVTSMDKRIQSPTEALGTERQSVSIMDTQVLYQENMISALKQIQQETDQSYGMFQIEKYTILIHTNERV